MAGSIFTRDMVKAQLEDANRNYYGQRTWADIFGNLDLSKQIGTENLLKNYGAVISEAYAASKANEAAILSSNLGQGLKNAALDENKIALEKAYDVYTSQYLSEQQEFNQSVENQRQEINKELDTLAQRTADYGNAHFDYLQTLWDKREKGELSFDPFANPNFARYVDEASGSLKPLNEIRNITHDAEGNLTQAGIDFFDMIEHDDILRDYSFADYLMENNEELYNWSVSDNPYNYSPNAVGLNINDGMFRRMVGQSSIDEQYSFLERAYGMGDGEIKSIFNGLNDAKNSLIASMDLDPSGIVGTKIKLHDEGNFDNAAKNFANEINTLVTKLGLSEAVSDILEGTGYNSVSDYVESLVKSYKNRISDVNEMSIPKSSKTVRGKNFFGAIVDVVKSLFSEPVEKRRSYAYYGVENKFNKLVSDLVNYSLTLND